MFKSQTLAVCALSTMMVPALAMAVDGRTMKYLIHDDPSDPTSDVVFEVALQLGVDTEIPDSTGPGGTVKWEVERITIVEFDNGSVAHTWNETLPNVDTTDGLWHIYHADLNNIDDADFTENPLIDGTAQHVGSGGNALDYSFDGEADGAAVYTVTGYATWEFSDSKTLEVFSSEDDKPVEVEEDM